MEEWHDSVRNTRFNFKEEAERYCLQASARLLFLSAG